MTVGKLKCSRCHGGNDEAQGGAINTAYKHPNDPETVIRCVECDKKHSKDSLVE